jgi:hypothetical protein
MRGVMRCRVEYEESGESITFSDTSACWIFVEKFESSVNRPTVIYVHNSNDECISCVVGAKKTYLVYYPQGYDGRGTYTSSSDNKGENLNFWFDGHHGEAGAEYLIPRDLLESIVTEFLVEGGMSKKVKWVSE